MKPKALKLLEQCIEDGVAYGLNRVYKRSDTVSREQMQQMIENAILHEVHEWFEFDQEPPT